MATRQAPSAVPAAQAVPAEDTRSAEMDLQDRQVLNVIQTAFPMDERPYLAIGRELEMEEDDVIERIRRMRRENVVRQISGIFDTRRLGYKTSLIAFRYPEELLHKGALAINKHPGVSHNYARVGHEYNLWFTLAVPPYESLEETAARMAEETHVESWRLLPTLRFFKIGVNFDMVNEEGNAADYRPDNAQWNQVEPLTEYEIEVVREVQGGPVAGRAAVRQDGVAAGADARGPVRHHARLRGAGRDAAVQRGAAPPEGGLPLQRDERVAGARGSGSWRSGRRWRTRGG